MVSLTVAINVVVINYPRPNQHSLARQRLNEANQRLDNNNGPMEATRRGDDTKSTIVDDAPPQQPYERGSATM